MVGVGPSELVGGKVGLGLMRTYAHSSYLSRTSHDSFFLTNELQPRAAYRIYVLRFPCPCLKAELSQFC